MPNDQEGIDLEVLSIPKAPLHYGTDSCYLTLTDSRFASEIVELRNTPALGKFVNYAELTIQDQQLWLAGQLMRDDALNFSLIAQRQFAGVLSLYNIEHGVRCEFGRMMMPDDGRRIFALAAEVLGMSFAFEVLGVQTLYCVVVEENESVLKFHLRNGWHKDPRYERHACVNGKNAHLIGLSVDRSEWPTCFAKMQPLAKRLLIPANKQASKQQTGDDDGAGS